MYSEYPVSKAEVDKANVANYLAAAEKKFKHSLGAPLRATEEEIESWCLIIAAADAAAHLDHAFTERELQEEIASLQRDVTRNKKHPVAAVLKRVDRSLFGLVNGDYAAAGHALLRDRTQDIAVLQRQLERKQRGEGTSDGHIIAQRQACVSAAKSAIDDLQQQYVPTLGNKAFSFAADVLKKMEDSQGPSRADFANLFDEIRLELHLGRRIYVNQPKLPVAPPAAPSLTRAQSFG